MPEMQFEKFYRALHNRDPFPWQRRFATRIQETGSWPKLVDLPTGSGKTSLLDLAVFALAFDDGRNDRAFPRRIFYVVDRRIIVDSTFLYAVHIAQRLKEASSGILREVADRLRAFSENKEQQRSVETEPLHVSILRGGMYREDSWARSPAQPVICVSTVDQVGSRLLFRGYGVSSRNWPIHAGLVGTDSLVILDEAHLSQPFAQTIEYVQLYAGPKWREQSIGNPVEFVKMTATPANEDGNEESTFRLNSEDESVAVLARRLNANKWASLEKFTDDEDNAGRDGGFARKIRDLA
jgi:CRISPR-associated endonuclease/helicase Cas3